MKEGSTVNLDYNESDYSENRDIMSLLTEYSIF